MTLTWMCHSSFISHEDFDKLNNPGSSLLAEPVRNFISTLTANTIQIPKLQKYRSHNEILQKIL